MYLTHHLGYFHIFILFVNCSKHLSDYAVLMQSYYLMCGPEYFCLPSNLTHGWEIRPNLSYRHMHVCPDCQCDTDCIKRGDCCADLYFSFPDLNCVNRTIIQGRYDENKTEQSSALMVTTCPTKTNDETKKKCVSLNDIKSRLRNFPVTGLQTPITFYNKYCAECHGVVNYSFWMLDIDCFHFTDFNFLSTLDEVIDAAFDGECIFQAFREDDVSGEIKQENCFDIDERGTVFTKCNQTGEWSTYDSNIAYACESFYKRKYRLFKNIFCYMCNPSGYDSAKGMFSSCNITGQWLTNDVGLQRACTELPMTRTTYPFKNIFCYFCNRGNDSTQMFVDIFGHLVEFPIDGTYFRYQYNLDISNFNLNFFRHMIRKKIEKDKSMSDVIHNPYDVSFFRTKDGTVINMTNLLLQKAAMDQVGVCKSRRFLYPKGYWNPCVCEISCLFGDDIHKCCDDLLLQIPMHCRDTLFANPFELPRHSGFPTVNGCFMESTRIVLQKGCTTQQSSDIYSQIPLSNENGVNYDNFYCVLCNFGSDEFINKMDGQVSNITFTGKLPLSKDFVFLDMFIKFQNQFKIWGNIEILCPKYLDYSHYLITGDLVDTAKRMQCRIQFKRDIKELRECLLEKASYRCADQSDWTYSDHGVEWACNNLTNYNESVYGANFFTLPKNSRYDKSEHKHYRSLSHYTNIYCSLCKPDQPFPEYFIENCTIRKNSQFCFHYPRIYYYYPFKNYHCAVCNDIEFYGHMGEGGERELDEFNRVVGINWFPVLRNLFSISEYYSSQEKTTLSQCKSNQAYDEYKDICRDITCYSGKNMNANECLPLLERTMNLQYSMTIETDMYGFNELFLNMSRTHETENMIEKIEKYFDVLLDFKADVKIEAIDIFDFEGEDVSSYCTFIKLKLFFESIVSRLLLEQHLIELKVRYGNRCDRNKPWPNGTVHTGLDIRKRIRKRFAPEPFSEGYFSAKVSNILLCQQIELDEDEYNVSNDNSILTLTRDGFSSIAFDEFARTPSGRMRVCLEYLRKIKYIAKQMTDGTITLDRQQKYLWIVSLVSSILSVLGLSLGLFVYFCFPSLRTTPGKLIMLLMAALLFALVFHQVSYFAVKIKSGCIAIAVVLHFLWLSVFLCTLTANFHMWRTFTSMEVGSTSERILLKYVMFIYGLATSLVFVDIAVGLGLHSDVWWGYGGSKCFINDTTLLIALFICPVALICVLNILLFALTARAIIRTPTADNNQSKRNELIIFVRLTTVTGISWVLQIIDSFLPFTYFTFISTTINSLQGLFIFIAFILNKRVWGLFSRNIQTFR